MCRIHSHLQSPCAVLVLLALLPSLIAFEAGDAVRLVPGPDYGRVEVLRRGDWGTVCGAWDNKAAAAVCRGLGYSGGNATTDYTQGSGRVMLGAVRCRDVDQSLWDCRYSEWGRPGCGHDTDAGVICDGAQVAPRLRLVGAGRSDRGRVEVWHDNRWGAVCGKQFGANEANVVCSQFGYTFGTPANFGLGTGPIWLDNVTCAGGEHTVSDCAHNAWGSHNCSLGPDAAVVCSNRTSCGRVWLAGSTHQAALHGEYVRLAGQDCTGRPVYGRQGGGSYLYVISGGDGPVWAVGSRACEMAAGILGPQDTGGPEGVTAAWLEWGTAWTGNTNITVTCMDCTAVLLGGSLHHTARHGLYTVSTRRCGGRAVYARGGGGGFLFPLWSEPARAYTWAAGCAPCADWVGITADAGATAASTPDLVSATWREYDSTFSFQWVSNLNISATCQAWVSWGAWTACSATCGVGTQTRTRLTCSAGCADPAMETRACPDPAPCTGADITWSSWGAYGDCLLGNGIGTKTRTRTCPNPNACTGSDVMTENCTVADTASWGEWGVYGACSVTCGAGTRGRSRSCFGTGFCIGNTTETEACALDVCAAWSTWGAWDACSQTCGTGVRGRSRSCVGAGFCLGDATMTEPCAADHCAGWTQWVAWGSCSVTCGSGTRGRSRSCSGAGTCTGNDAETEACSPGSCAGWTQWTQWGSCSVTCGSGTRGRSRSCNGAGTCTGSAIETETCAPGVCAGWTQWTQWGSCSVTCGSGTRGRSRSCNGVGTCTGNAAETEACAPGVCAAWSGWSAWGSCSVTCGAGTRGRSRTCAGLGQCTTGGSTDTQSCNPGVCAAWGPWGQYGACSVTCGVGTRGRSRSCVGLGSCGGGASSGSETCVQSACPTAAPPATTRAPTRAPTTTTRTTTTAPPPAPGPSAGIELFACTFETDVCGMTQSAADATDWARHTGTTSSRGTGPAGAARGSYYIYLEGSSPLQTGQGAVIITPELRPKGTTLCVEMYYVLNGLHIGEFEVSLRERQAASSVILYKQKRQGADWIYFQKQVTCTTTCTLILRAVKGNGHQSDIGVDELRVTDGACGAAPNTGTTTAIPTIPPFSGGTQGGSVQPFRCSFEADLCGMTQPATALLKWQRHTATTPSKETGPQGAYAGAYYAYMEGSGPAKQGNTAILASPAFARDGPMCVQVAYHMLGQHIGSLQLYATTGSLINPFLNVTRNQGDAWHVFNKKVTWSSGQMLIIQAVRGSEYQSDIAVDDVAISPCN